MKKMTAILALLLFVSLTAFRPMAGRLITKAAHVSFFSHTPVEDITANNYKAVSTLDPATGEVVFSIPMQSFEFEKALMQEHFNGKDFLNTKDFPKAKFDGKISNLSAINFGADGSYEATVEGTMTIKEVTKPIQILGMLTIRGGSATAESKFKLVLADYGITFKKGKPSTNIAKEVEVTLKAEYQSE